SGGVRHLDLSLGCGDGLGADEMCDDLYNRPSDEDVVIVARGDREIIPCHLTEADAACAAIYEQAVARAGGNEQILEPRAEIDRLQLDSSTDDCASTLAAID